jgi:hypothetical protein
MTRPAAGRIMLAMTRPIRSSRLVLVADPRPSSPIPETVPLRRYRLARLRLEARSPEASERFAHLKRVFD